jgi:hypothetical protein
VNRHSDVFLQENADCDLYAAALDRIASQKGIQMNALL